VTTTNTRPEGIRRLLVAEWREIGGLGRIAVIGIVAAMALAIVLGFEITAAARGHLLDARAEILAAITGDLADEYDPSDPTAGVFDSAVRERLLGGETVRVKVWLGDGTVVYSDDERLVGQVFELSDSAAAAFTGERSSQVSDLSEDAHADHRHLGSLIEFYLPFTTSAGSVESVFEVEQRTDLLETALGRVERNVWLSIGIGLGVLGVFLGALALARVRDLNRRRRRAERVLGDSLRVQDQERRRIVGSLHDDVGQPLYRLLYGLEGTSARMDPDDPLRAEIESLADLVHQVDATLRAELRILHRGLLADLGLGTALEDLVETVRQETDLDVSLNLAADMDLPDVTRQALFRAAAEAITNVRRHAAATRIEVTVSPADGMVELAVADDGNGRMAEAGLGITTNRERLETIGGDLEITARPGVGTIVVARVPIDREGAS
jgi:signal transduction histidine kinase